MDCKASLHKKTRIKVEFPFHPKAVQVVRDIPGSHFTSREKGGPFWTLPLSMVSAKELKEAFSGEGDSVKYDKALLEWGRKERDKQRNLSGMAEAEDTKLPNLEALDVRIPKEMRRSTKELKEKGLPKGYDSRPLHKWMRDYQRVTAKCMTEHFINSDQQGLGKTIEWIAAVYELELADSYHCVSAPVTALETVWAAELEKWMDTTILTGDTPALRKLAIDVALEMYEAEEPFVLLINPAMAMMQWEEVGKEGDKIRVPKNPILEQIKFATFTVDECHKMGIGNPDGINNPKKPEKAMREAHVRIGRSCDYFWPMSGTLMGGKPIKLWATLEAVKPEEFTSKWHFAGVYLDVTENEHGKTIEGVRPDKEEALRDLVALHVVRHLKEDVLTELPPKQYVDVWCKMHPKQAKQYEQFAKEAEIKIETERLSAMSILDEYTRLKQFSCAYQKVENVAGKTELSKVMRELGLSTKGLTIPEMMAELEALDIDAEVLRGFKQKWLLTPQAEFSGKLPYLVDHLAEQGIDKDNPEGDSVAVVGSQFKQVVIMIHSYLNSIGIKAEMITGDTKEKDRTELVKWFQAGGSDAPRVIVVTTTAAGVALTLDKADTIHLMDETWNPDDQEQLEDRIHRASRIHQVTCYYYRSEDTLEEYIKDVTEGKIEINKNILDLRKQGLRAV